MSDLAEDAPESVTVEPVADDVPHELGRYRLAFEFAAGGMATVYLAREVGESGMNRVVALKCIHRHLAKRQAFVDMFLDEARVAARINHPNVCSVYDFGQVDGMYYIAMEYLVGETFARVVRRMFHKGSERPSPLNVAHVIADACEGLHAAHELRGPDGKPMDVVHRDVSPSNIYVCYDGTTRIVDFGIAKAADKLYATRTGEVKGKLAYLAPEQIEQESVDRRADVWSLGVVLWESLTGKRLFRRATDAKTILAVVQDPVHPPSVYDENLPDGLDEVVLKSLERDPAKRYQTAREMGRALREVFMRHRVVVGAPEIGDWMGALFPQEGPARLALIEQTLRVEASTGVIERVSGDLTGEISKTSGIVSDVKARAKKQDGVATKELGPKKAKQLADESVHAAITKPSVKDRQTKQIEIPDDDSDVIAPPAELPPAASFLDQYPALEDDPEEGDPTFVAARPSMEEVAAFQPPRPTEDPTVQPTRMVQRPRVHSAIDSIDVDVDSDSSPDTVPPISAGEQMPMPQMPKPAPVPGVLSGLPDLSVGPTMADEFSSEVTRLVDHDVDSGDDFDESQFQEHDPTVMDVHAMGVPRPSYGDSIDSHISTLEKSLDFEDSTLDKDPPPTQSLAPFQLPDDLPPVEEEKSRTKVIVLGVVALALAGTLVWLLVSGQQGEPTQMAQAPQSDEAAAEAEAEAETEAEAEAEAEAESESASASASESEAEADTEADTEAEAATAAAAEAEAEAATESDNETDTESDTDTESESESAAATTMRPRRGMGPRMNPRMAPVMGPTRIDAAPGSVLVVTVGGWADVSVGRRALGRAPGRFDLPAGRHTLTIKPFGMNPAIRRVVRVQSGETARVPVTVMR